MQKYDIINALAKRHGLHSYLEICTPSTGHEFRNIDREQFETCDRLIYYCAPEWDDELPITLRTPECSSLPLVRALVEQHGNARYDIVFVDSWHTYACSSVDLSGALRLLADGGIIVAHDCDPRDPTIMTPEYREKSWCGVTYAAFIDFVLPRNAFKYYTVDSDFGCGVVFTDPSRSAYVPRIHDRRALECEWRAGQNNDERLAFYLAHRAALLNVISPAEIRRDRGYHL
jgi:hypothetical protein